MPVRSMRWGCRIGVMIAPLAVALALAGAAAATGSPASVAVVLSGSATGTVVTGDTITYSLAVSNAGSTDSGPVQITDDFLAFDVNSASCGSLPNCAVTIDGGAVECPEPPTVCTGGFVPMGVTWRITSVPAEASGLTVSVAASVYNSGTDQATWTGDGCSASSGFCTTNTVRNPVALVSVSETTSPPPRPVSFRSGDGTTLSVGQVVSASLGVANGGDAPSGAVTVVASIPPTTGTDYVPGSATCGTVPGCTLTVTPCTTTCPAFQSPCGVGEAACLFVLPAPCGCATVTRTGTLLTWTITSVPAGASGLALPYAVEVNGATSDIAVATAMWTGHLSPAATLSDGLQSSGDGCVSTAAISPYPGFFGCLVSPIEAVYDVTGPPVPPTTTPPVPPTTAPQPVTGVSSGVSSSTMARPVSAGATALALTGPGPVVAWIAALGGLLVLLGVALVVPVDLPRRLMTRAARWLLAR